MHGDVAWAGKVDFWWCERVGGREDEGEGEERAGVGGVRGAVHEGGPGQEGVVVEGAEVGEVWVWGGGVGLEFVH